MAVPQSGVMECECGGGKYGFIRPDAGGENMFVMPNACAGFGGQLPPVGTPLQYFVVVDEKTGKPRAEDVQPAGFGGDAPQTGVMLAVHAKYGFITPDAGGENMFVIPSACVGFGGQFPPVGTRVRYAVVADEKTGRPRADDVEPAWGGGGVLALTMGKGGKGLPVTPVRKGKGPTAGKGKGPMPPLRMLPWNAQTSPPPPQPPVRVAPIQVSMSLQPGPLTGPAMGTFAFDHGRYGFITPDAGGDNLFVMPNACAAFGGTLPPKGARVQYVVVTDEKTGRPRAEDVQPPTAAGGQPAVQRGRPAGGGRPAAPPPSRVAPYPNLPVVPVISATPARPAPAPAAAPVAAAPIDAPPGAADAGGMDTDDTPRRIEQAREALAFLEQRSLPTAEVQGQLDALLAQQQQQQAREAPPGAEALPSAERHAGAMLSAQPSGRFGFIQPDGGGENMFVLPGVCEAFGNELPAPGTRLTYCVVTDQKTGKPRATDVQPE